MEEAKSQYAEVELFTGVLEGTEIHKKLLVRELSGIEEDVLASKKMSVSKKITTVLANCIIKFGTIEDRHVIMKMTDRMTISDRIYLLIQLRSISVSEVLEFTSTCPACSHEDKKVFELSQVHVKNPPTADDLFKDVVLPSGKKIRIKVADGSVEEKIEKATNESNAATIALFARCEALDDKPVNLVNIKTLSFKDRNALRKAIDELEGELDDKFRAQCPNCGHEYESEIPINGVDFFFP